MTREEAIRIIEKEIHIDVRHCSHEDACRFEDALRMAISALREQEAKEPCEACNFFADSREQDFGLYETIVFEFCPMCGRILEA